MPKQLVVWGASGHALVVADIIRLREQYEIVGFLDDINPARSGAMFAGAPILGGAERLDALRAEGVGCLIFGFGDCDARLRLAQIVIERGFELVTAIHPQAVVARDATVGPGTVIVAAAVVNSGSHIGANTVINTSASVDHECDIADGALVGPGVHMGSRVVVGRGAWIGIGATVKDRVRIGARSIIGAGSVVLKDIPPNVIAYGVPAKIIRSREDD